MAEKCFLCKEKIKTKFLDKIDGTIVKIKEDDKNKNVYICADCQKQHKNLKEEIIKNSKE